MTFELHFVALCRLCTCLKLLAKVKVRAPNHKNVKELSHGLAWTPKTGLHNFPEMLAHGPIGTYTNGLPNLLRPLMLTIGAALYG